MDDWTWLERQRGHNITHCVIYCLVDSFCDTHELDEPSIVTYLLHSLWNFDTENHTETFCDTEKTRKLH